MKKILFICTGNTCRSPMAAGLMNKLLKDAKITDFYAESAGIAAFPGSPASQNAVLAAAGAGVDLKSHKARRLSELDLSSYEKIYVMTEGLLKAMETAFPGLSGRISVLGEGIPDPYGGSLEEYRLCLNKMEPELKKIIKRIAPDAENDNNKYE